MRNEERIWICEECNKTFTEKDLVEVCTCMHTEWGHKCKAHPRSKKPWRCEAYLQEYISK